MQYTRVKLTQQSIDFSLKEGEEIFKNSRSLKPSDTLEIKVRNCLYGCFGQQQFIESTAGRRATKEECPDFSFDVLCANPRIHEYVGWSFKVPSEINARVEVKTIVTNFQRRGWISFNDSNFNWATECAANGNSDYLAFYGIHSIDLEKYEADVALLGVTASRVLVDSNCRQPSKYAVGDSFLNTHRIHDRNLGRIFL